jgi:hypothetical protein
MAEISDFVAVLSCALAERNMFNNIVFKAHIHATR